MPTAPLKNLYSLYYAAGKESFALRLYYMWMRSPLAVKSLFGMKVLSEAELNNLSIYFTKFPVYFNLTTVLMKNVLKERVRNSPNLKLLEIGIGAFAVLSGCVSRWVTPTIDAIDIDTACVESAKKHVELNQVNVRVFESDLFSSLPACQYDIIFWNPPYKTDPNKYLPGLFKAAPDFMHENTLVMISYNTKYFPREAFLEILSNYDRLRVNQVKTWWWNIHEVLVIGKI